MNRKKEKGSDRYLIPLAHPLSFSPHTRQSKGDMLPFLTKYEGHNITAKQNRKRRESSHESYCKNSIEPSFPRPY